MRQKATARVSLPQKHSLNHATPVNREEIARIIADTPVTDIHTHLYDPAFGQLLLWGIDDLLVYHYLVAEGFRYFDLPYEKFWSWRKTQQADAIWHALFIEHSPLSEACRGVLTTLHALGLDVKKRDLKSLRQWFLAQNVKSYVSQCMDLAKVQRLYMTNSPFDDLERPVWEKGFARDERFLAALRIDPLLLAWPEASLKLAQWGYRVDVQRLTPKSLSAVRRFLADWTHKINARYLMVSLPPDWHFPAENTCNRLIQDAVLPHCREYKLPLALMPGVRRAVNPQLRLAGDGLGSCCVNSFTQLFAHHPENKFLLTALSRENQHEFCIAARKFRNLHLFGCWWFTNIPHLIDEITRMRLELLGLSFTPQHSDARVMDQIIYKWQHSKEVISNVLIEKYKALQSVGWTPTRVEIKRDAQDLLGGAFERFCQS